MPYTVALPDGRTVEFPDDVPHAKAVEIIKRQMGGGEPPPQGGFVPALKAGAASAQQGLANLGAELGLRDAEGADKTIQGLEDYKNKTFKPTTEGWADAPWQNFKETLGGSIPQMAAPIAAGAFTGPVGAGLMSLAQFTGSNLERQRGEGAQVGQANLGAAAAAAVPQAAMDVLSMKMIPGVRAIFGKMGGELTDEAAQKIAKQAFSKTAADYMLQTGKAMGVEGTTEVAQQALERLQAGLSIDDPKAREEYIQSFIGGAVLGGALAPAGRFMERGKIKQQAQIADRKEEAAAAVAQTEQDAKNKAEQEQRAQDPAYLDDLEKRYAATMEQFNKLDAAAKGKADKADFFGQQKLTAARKARDEFRNTPEVKSLVDELTVAQPYLEQRQAAKAQEAQGQQFDQQWKDQSQQAPNSPEEFAASLDAQIKAAQKMGGVEGEREVARLQQLQQNARTPQPGPWDTPQRAPFQAAERLFDAANPNAYTDWQGMTAEVEKRIGLANQRNLELSEKGAPIEERLAAAKNLSTLQGLKNQLATAGKTIPKPTTPEARIKLLEKKANDAAVMGENPQKYLEELQQLQQQPSLFDDKANGSLQADAKLGEEMGAEREAAAQRSKRVQEEIEALHRIGERGPTSPEYLAAVHRAIGLSDDFVAPNVPGETLGLPPDRLAIYEKQQARQAMRNMRQKAQQAKTPLGEYAMTRRQQLLDQWRAEQADEAGRKAKLEAQKQTKLGSPVPEDQRPINLSDESDKRISALIDQLLPKAVGVGDRVDVGQQELDMGVPRADVRTQGEITKPIGASARAFQGPRRVPGPGIPALDSFNTLEQLRESIDRARELNDQIKRAGSPKDPALRAARNEAIAERNKLNEKIVKLKKRHAANEGYGRPEQAPEEVGPPRPRETVSQGREQDLTQQSIPQPDTQNVSAGQFSATKDNQGFEVSPAKPIGKQGEMFPTKPFQPKPIKPGELQAARTAQVEAQSRLERLRKAQGMGATTPQYYRDAASSRQLEADAMKRDPAKMAERGAQERIAKLEAEAKRFLQRERMAGAGGNLKDHLAKAIATAQEEVNKAKAKIAELEARDRRAEQQQAANEGRDVGDLEADRINEGDTDGYRDARGRPLRTTPKSKKSWDVREQLKVKREPVTSLMKAQKAVEEAEKKARIAELEYADIGDNVKKLKSALDGVYDNTKEREIAETLAQLAKDDITPMAWVQDRYTEGKDIPALAKELAATEEKSKARLQQKYAAKEKAYAKWKDAVFLGVAADRQSVLARTDYEATSALGEAKVDFQRAQANRVELERLIGESAKAAYKAALEADRAGKYPAVEEANKGVREAMGSVEAERQAEHNAPRLADKTLVEVSPKRFAVEPKNAAAQREASETRAAIQTGLGLPGTRTGRDTTKVTQFQNDIKRAIATADTMLDKARRAGDSAAAIKLDRRVRALNKLLDSSYKVAPKVTEEIGSETVSQGADTQEGMRLGARKIGATVRNTAGANKRAMQSGSARLTSEGMSREAANAISVFTLKAKLDAAEGEAKARYQSAWDTLTKGVEDVDAMVKEGERLSGLGPTAQLIGARQRVMDAQETADHWHKEKVEAGAADNATAKELAALKEEAALKEVEGAKLAYKDAKAAYEQSQIARSATPEEIASAAYDPADFKVALSEETTGKSAFKAKGAKPTPTNTAEHREGQKKLQQQAQFTRWQKKYGKKDKTKFRTSSTGTGMSQSAVSRATEKISSRWPAGPDVVVVQSENELPFTIPAGEEGSHPGAFHDGTVYLVADNLHNENDVALTLAHEVSGHYGLRSMLGEDYGRTMKALYAGNDKVRAAADSKIDSGLDRDTAVEEVLAEMAETNPRDSSLKRAYYAVKRALFRLLGIKNISDGEVAQIVANARRHVEEGASDPKGRRGDAPVYRTRDPKYDVLIGKPAGNLLSNAQEQGASTTGLKVRVAIFDRLGGFEEGINRAEKGGKITHEQAISAHYWARFSENVNQAVAQFVGAGRVFIDKKTGTYATKRGTATLMKVFQHGGDGAEALGKSRDEGNEMLTVLATGQRAEAVRDGWARLGGKNAALQQALYSQIRREVDANPKAKASFDAALRQYKEYNDGLIDFLAQSGAITQEEARRLQSTDYAPFYRVDGDDVKLFTDKEKPVVIGNIKNQPELKQMLGDEHTILPLLESATKNTYLIARMAMRNKQTSEMASVLYKAGFVSKMGKGDKISGNDVVHYKVDGVGHFAVIDKDAFGVPAELVVKGMEGIKTTIPAVMKMMGVPAHWVRKMVTRMPTYAIRQMLRDPINSMFISGMDPSGVAGAFKNIGKSLGSIAAGKGADPHEKELMDALVVTSNIYANDAGDMTKVMQQAVRGNANAANQFLGMLDDVAQSADAATRTVLYDDARKKGLSHAEASLRALESMNFNRRGLSPSMHMISTIVPFFNAQVQGLDVLWKAARGKLPFNEQLQIRQKLVTRGLMLGAMATAYALSMKDDEDYRKLKPQERYQNFHIRVPGVKDFVKIPIPYEVGVIFKALPEALIDAAFSDTKAKDAAVGMAFVINNSIPKPWAVPAIAPLVLASMNQSGFGEIESKREQQLESNMRYRDTTPELLKMTGDALHSVGIDSLSPMKQEFLLRSYTGMLGLGLMRVLLDPVVLRMRGEEGIPRPNGSEADTPFVGTLFQRTDGRFLIDRAYERMDEITKAKKTFDELVSQGQRAKAKQYAQDKSDELVMADMAGSFRQEMGANFALERSIRMDNKRTPEEKDALLDKIKKLQNRQAEAFYAASEKRKALRDRQ